MLFILFALGMELLRFVLLCALCKTGQRGLGKLIFDCHEACFIIAYADDLIWYLDEHDFSVW